MVSSRCSGIQYHCVAGKSAHGTADTDMAGLLGQLQVPHPLLLLLPAHQREADDLCGHRGLTAGSDHQTFSMSLPHKLRAYYDKVLPSSGLIPSSCLQVVTPSGSRGAPRARLTGAVLEGVVQAYSTMNRCQHAVVMVSTCRCQVPDKIPGARTKGP